MNIKYIAATLSFLGLGDREGNDSVDPNQRVPTKLITLEKLNLPTVIGGISLLGALSLLGYSISTSGSSHSRRRDLQIPCANHSTLDQADLRTQNDSGEVECTNNLQDQKTPCASFRLMNSAHTSPYSHPQLTRETPLPRLTSIAEELSVSCEQLAQAGKITNPGTSASETTPLISRLKQSASSLDTADRGNHRGMSTHQASHVTHRHLPDSTSTFSPHGKLTVDA